MAHSAARPATPTIDPRFPCPPDCPDCVQYPGHQAEAHRLGVGYGQRYNTFSLAAEINYTKNRLKETDPLAAPFLYGILDALEAKAATAAAVTE